MTNQWKCFWWGIGSNSRTTIACVDIIECQCTLLQIGGNGLADIRTLGSDAAMILRRSDADALILGHSEDAVPLCAFDVKGKVARRSEPKREVVSSGKFRS